MFKVQSTAMMEIKNATALIDALADILRLPDETSAMTHLYVNKYQRQVQVSDHYGLLDLSTVSIACLTLAAKATESPRRLSAIILPAYTLLRPPPQPPVLIPSTQYDTLRTTVVQAEMLLLRIFAFELRVPSPLDFVPRYLARAFEQVRNVSEDFDQLTKEEMEELGVVEPKHGGLERSAKLRAIQACKHYRLANLFPPRDVALGCLFLALEQVGIIVEKGLGAWIDEISCGKVDIEDFKEVVDILRRS